MMLTSGVSGAVGGEDWGLQGGWETHLGLEVATYNHRRTDSELCV